MKIPLLNLKKQYSSIKDDIERVVSEVLKSGSYISGPYVKKFEGKVANYLGVKHAIGVANGTDALVIALKSLGIGSGDEVITTPFTFFATAEAISIVGATPVFVDVKLTDFNIDEIKIEEKITEKTKAIMPVHIFGNPSEMDKINEIAEKYNLYVIEDACQAIGSKYKERMVGSIGNVACFSFFPTKNLGTYGDGGLITTNDDKLAALCRAIKAHGSGSQGEKAYNMLHNIENAELEETENTVYNPKKYYNYFIGHNSRLDEIHAAILDIKLDYLDEWNQKRIDTAKYYNKQLENSKFKLMELDEENKNVYHMYILQSEKRDEVVSKLKDVGIATGVYYPIPLHLQKVYKDLGYVIGDLPNAEYLSKRTFAIPVDPELENVEKEKIIGKIFMILDKSK